MDVYLTRRLLKAFTKKGNVVLDPMCGTGTTLVEAMLLGRNAVGVDIEDKFTSLTNKNLENVEKTNSESRFKLELGNAKVLTGDSRRLAGLLQEADVILTSPPYSEQLQAKADYEKRKERLKKLGFTKKTHGLLRGQKSSSKVVGGDERYSDKPENIGNLKHGELADVVLTSPPYATAWGEGEANKIKATVAREERHKKRHPDKFRPALIVYSTEEKNIGNLPHKQDVDTIITSPPFAEANRGGGIAQKGYKGKHRVDATLHDMTLHLRHDRPLSDNPENISNLPLGKVDAVITSPPYENVKTTISKEEAEKKKCLINRARRQRGEIKGGKGESGKLGRSQIGDSMYSQKPENISNIKQHGKIDTIITSPPYEAAFNVKQHTLSGIAKRDPKLRVGVGGYGATDANIGNLRRAKQGVDVILSVFGNKNKRGGGWGTTIINEAWLRRQYLEEKKTMQEIAELLGVSRTCIRNNIYRHNIRVMEQWERYFDGCFDDLDEEQQQLLIGTILGDTSIMNNQETNYAEIRFCHSTQQLGYLKWKVFLLQEFFKSKPKKRKDNETYAIASITHPIFKQLWNIFYITGRKSVREEILNKLQPLGIAIWFMDDGFVYGATKRKGWKGNLALSTASFTRKEHEIIISWFKQQWNITAKIHERSDGHLEIHFPSEASRQLKKLIEPFVLPLFGYKLDISKSRSDAKTEYWKNRHEQEKETYLLAMLKCYREMHAVLKPGGLAILVLKNFIRNFKVVDLVSDTIKLCEFVGFKLTKKIKFMLPTKSFWRVLYQRKYEKKFGKALSKEFDSVYKYETVLVFEKA